MGKLDAANIACSAVRFKSAFANVREWHRCSGRGRRENWMRRTLLARLAASSFSAENVRAETSAAGRERWTRQTLLARSSASRLLAENVRAETRAGQTRKLDAADLACSAGRYKFFGGKHASRDVGSWMGKQDAADFACSVVRFKSAFANMREWHRCSGRGRRENWMRRT